MFLLLSKGRQCVLDDEVEQEKQVIFPYSQTMIRAQQWVVDIYNNKVSRYTTLFSFFLSTVSSAFCQIPLPSLRLHPHYNTLFEGVALLSVHMHTSTLSHARTLFFFDSNLLGTGKAEMRADDKTKTRKKILVKCVICLSSSPLHNENGEQ